MKNKGEKELEKEIQTLDKEIEEVKINREKVDRLNDKALSQPKSNQGVSSTEILEIKDFI